MSDKKRFPVLGGGLIDFDLVEAKRSRIERWHSQTLERLAERGGLSTEELMFHEVLPRGKSAAELKADRNLAVNGRYPDQGHP